MFLLGFNHIGPQPSVAGDLDFYTEPSDFEMLTTSYFISKIRHIKNRLNLTVTKETMSVSLMGPNGQQYQPAPRETLQTAQKGLNGQLPLYQCWAKQTTQTFPFPKYQISSASPELYQDQKMGINICSFT